MARQVTAYCANAVTEVIGKAQLNYFQMEACWTAIMDGCEMCSAASQQLDEAGFTVIPGPVSPQDLGQLATAYDAVVGNAATRDIKIGSSTTRVNDFVNRDPAFDGLYLYQPILKASCRIIDQPIKLSTMHARTLRPMQPAQQLHVDYERDDQGWTMVGFVFMVDEFRKDNGATRFLPGSHLWSALPPELLSDLKADYPGQVLACGQAGSMIVFNGSVWHGHTANRCDQPRRSIQGAYIRRSAPSGFDLAARMLPETLSRFSPLAKYLLAVKPTQSSGPTS